MKTVVKVMPVSRLIMGLSVMALFATTLGAAEPTAAPLTPADPSPTANSPAATPAAAPASTPAVTPTPMPATMPAPTVTPALSSSPAAPNSEAADLQPAVRTSESAARPAAPRGSARNAADRLDLETTQITGSRELPRVLYVVPWKRSDLGDLTGRPVNSLLDEVLAPVDRDVFQRQNRYYEALRPDTSAVSGSEAAGEK